MRAWPCWPRWQGARALRQKRRPICWSPTQGSTPPMGRPRSTRHWRCAAIGSWPSGVGGSGAAARTGHRRHRRPGSQRRARLQRHPPAPVRRRVRRRARRRRRGPRRGGAGHTARVRRGPAVAAVGARRGLALQHVPRRAADPRAARCRGRRPAGVHPLLRLPHRLGQLEGAGPGGHHPRHARSGERPHRPRSAHRRADRGAAGERAGTGVGAAARANRRRSAGSARGRDREAACGRRHQRAERARLGRRVRGLRSRPQGRTAGAAGLLRRVAGRTLLVGTAAADHVRDGRRLGRACAPATPPTRISVSAWSSSSSTA